MRNKPMTNLRIGPVSGHLFYPPVFAALGKRPSWSPQQLITGTKKGKKNE
jgi:hypothetical protein